MRISIARPDIGAVRALVADRRTEAERYCAAIARRDAKNFYWGFIALPRAKRTAIYALYDFARQVDDDCDLAEGIDARPRLTAQRDRLYRCAAGLADDPVSRVLGQAMERYQIPVEEVEEIIDGVESDLGFPRYRSWFELERYCHKVASSVGRMCVRIFGFSDPVALQYADDLGSAMQLTNILRDVREDLDQNRLYLPLDELEQYGLGEDTLRRAGRDLRLSAGASPAWSRFVHHQADRARALYDSGLRVIDFIPASSAACVLTMAGIYQRLLARITDDPALVWRTRVSLPTPMKLEVALSAWLRALSR